MTTERRAPYSGSSLLFIVMAFVVLGLAGPLARRAVADSGRAIPAPVLDSPADGDGLQTVVLAGGCFWGIQAVFQHVEGVQQAISGYAGGDTPDPTYEEVAGGRTGHAEAVQVTFDPRKVSYGKILQIFFSVAHDPTQLNRQGPDFGPQYRSAIFFTHESERRIAASYVAQLDAAAAFRRPIVTRIDPLTKFYPAEAYHQDYVLNYPYRAYVVYNDLPKVEDLQRLFRDVYRERPVTVAAMGAAR